MSQSGVTDKLTEDERGLFIAFSVLGFCLSQARKKRKFDVGLIQKVIKNQPNKLLILNNLSLFIDGLRHQNEARLSPEHQITLKHLRAKIRTKKVD